MNAWLEDFKKFLIQGNLVTLAVAFVIGAAFAAVVKALVADIITPIIALIFGQPNFENLSFSINSSHFLYGDPQCPLRLRGDRCGCVLLRGQALRDPPGAPRPRSGPRRQGVPGVHDRDPL